MEFVFLLENTSFEDLKVSDSVSVSLLKEVEEVFCSESCRIDEKFELDLKLSKMDK